MHHQGFFSTLAGRQGSSALSSSESLMERASSEGRAAKIVAAANEKTAAMVT
jgi:hypothetical protein